MISVEPCAVAEVLDSHELIAEYAAECSIAAIGEINPQHDTYALMERNGMLQSFMVFETSNNSPDRTSKIGFAIVLTPVLPHYGKRIATMESLFVSRESRSTSAGRDLMRAVEHYAQRAGCAGILYSSPAGGQLEGLLSARKEYQRTNAVFYRGFA